MSEVSKYEAASQAYSSLACLSNLEVLQSFADRRAEELAEVLEFARRPNFFAFAAILRDGTVVTWGMPSFGGNSDDQQAHLTNVKQIQATHEAFAAPMAQS